MAISEKEELEKIKSCFTKIVSLAERTNRELLLLNLGRRPRETLLEKTREYQDKFQEFLTNFTKISNLLVALMGLSDSLAGWEKACQGQPTPDSFYQLKAEILDLTISLSDFLEVKINRLPKIKSKLSEWGGLIERLKEVK